MPDLFEKGKISVETPETYHDLHRIARSLHNLGNRYQKFFEARFPSIEPTSAALERIGLGLLPEAERAYSAPRLRGVVEDLVRTAEEPIDDELTRYYRDLFQEDLRGRLASRGLIGQGTGERIETDANRDWLMEARNRSDARRVAATQAAQAIESGDYSLANQIASAATGAVTESFAFPGRVGEAHASIRKWPQDIFTFLANLKQQQNLAETQFTEQYGVSPWDQAMNVLADLGTIAGSVTGAAMGNPMALGSMSSLKTSDRGGSGASFAPIPATPSASSTPWSAPGTPIAMGTTLWGTPMYPTAAPTMYPGYQDLYNQGGALARTGQNRWIYG